MFQQPRLQEEACETPSPPSGHGGGPPAHCCSALRGDGVLAGGCPGTRLSGRDLPPDWKQLPYSGVYDEPGHGPGPASHGGQREEPPPTCWFLRSKVHKGCREEICL